MRNLASLRMSEVLQMGRDLEMVGMACLSQEGASASVVRYLYNELGDEVTGRRACPLVRLYCTARFESLEPELQEFARRAAGGHSVSPDTVCLRLLASAGDIPAWNRPERSVNHRCIPLVSEEVVHQMPMVAQLIRQLGLEVRDILNPDPNLLLDLSTRTYNVFWVPDAAGSPYIPAQDFVAQHHIRSVVGFGSLLPGGSLFAVVLFSRIPIPNAQAGRFKPLAMNVRAILERFYEPMRAPSAG